MTDEDLPENGIFFSFYFISKELISLFKMKKFTTFIFLKNCLWGFLRFKLLIKLLKCAFISLSDIEEKLLKVMAITFYLFEAELLSDTLSWGWTSKWYSHLRLSFKTTLRVETMLQNDTLIWRWALNRDFGTFEMKLSFKHEATLKFETELQIESFLWLSFKLSLYFKAELQIESLF